MKIPNLIHQLFKSSAYLKAGIITLLGLVELPAIVTAEMKSIYLEDKDSHSYLITTSLDTQYIQNLLQKKICGVSSHNMNVASISFSQSEIAKMCQIAQDTYAIYFKRLSADEVENDFTHCMTQVLKKICESVNNNAGAFQFTYAFASGVLLLALTFYLYQRYNYTPPMKQNLSPILERTPDKTGASDKVDKLRKEIKKLSEEHNEDKEINVQLEKISDDINTIEEKYTCVFSLGIVNDPISMSTGLVYDKSAIRKWLERGNIKCPKSKITFTETADSLPETSETAYNEIQSALASAEEALLSIQQKQTLRLR